MPFGGIAWRVILEPTITYPLPERERRAGRQPPRTCRATEQRSVRSWTAAGLTLDERKHLA